MFYTVGPESETDFGIPVNFAKFLWNMVASFTAVIWYALWSVQVFCGCRMESGTPGQVVGMARLNIG